jgi:thioredoxin 1
MDVRRIGSGRWNSLAGMIVVMATMPVAGCALSRATEHRAAAAVLPDAASVAAVRDLMPPPAALAPTSVGTTDAIVASNESPGIAAQPSRPPLEAGGEEPAPPVNVVSAVQTSYPTIRSVAVEAPVANARGPSAEERAPAHKVATAAPASAGRPEMGRVLHASVATFERHVLRADVPVLVDFYASWCGPCKALAPTLESLAAENPGARVVKVNIDDSPQLAARYGVKSVPSLLVFRGGQVVAQQAGATSKARLKAMLDL